MNRDEVIEGFRESVRFFGVECKSERELWVARTFLANLSINPIESELVVVSPGEDPPDVQFRGARFEIKELLDPGRRRHQEFKQALASAEVADCPTNELGPFTPKDLALSDLCFRIETEARCLISKYATVMDSLDLLFYVNLRDVMKLTEVPWPDLTSMHSLGWRSISFLMGRRSCVLMAHEEAPPFLRNNQGVVVYGPWQ